MQTFILDRNPAIAAQSLADIHVNKILCETTQILASARYLNDMRNPARMPAPTHLHHPIVEWAAGSVAARRWLIRYGIALCDEFRYRYEHDHAYGCLYAPTSPLHLDRRDDGIPLEFVQAMPDGYRTRDAVAAYRRYYAVGKNRLLRYTRRRPPDWLIALTDVFRVAKPEYRSEVGDIYA